MEPINQNAGASQPQGAAAGGQPASQPPDGAELETMRQQAREFQDLQTVAKAAGFDNVNDYVAALEDNYVARVDGANGQPQTPAAQQPPAGQPAATTGGLSAEDRQLMQAAQQAGFGGQVQGQYVEYMMVQQGKPEPERQPHAKKELWDVVLKQGALVREIVKDPTFEGNIFSAAAHILTIKKGLPSARLQGAASANALNNAAQSANINVGGPTPTPQNLTPQQQFAADNQKRARTIAPVTPYFMPKG